MLPCLLLGRLLRVLPPDRVLLCGGPERGEPGRDPIGALLAGMDATADVEITGEDVMTVGSYRLGLPELATIARVSRERAEEPGIDGVVVTHGTDTMEETAFLADLLNGTDTPVVFTGAQRAADHPDTDGPRNLRQAVSRTRNAGVTVEIVGVVRLPW